MAGWFTVERLDDDTYAISEYRHWEHTHCYLLLGRERALVIDTGLGVAPLAPVVGALTCLPVAAALTHAHWDHMGGLGGLRGKMGPRAGGRMAIRLFPSAPFCGKI